MVVRTIIGIIVRSQNGCYLGNGPSQVHMFAESDQEWVLCNVDTVARQLPDLKHIEADFYFSLRHIQLLTASIVAGYRAWPVETTADVLCDKEWQRMTPLVTCRNRR